MHFFSSWSWTRFGKRCPCQPSYRLGRDVGYFCSRHRKPARWVECGRAGPRRLGGLKRCGFLAIACMHSDTLAGETWIRRPTLQPVLAWAERDDRWRFVLSRRGCQPSLSGRVLFWIACVEPARLEIQMALDCVSRAYPAQAKPDSPATSPLLLAPMPSSVPAALIARLFSDGEDREWMAHQTLARRGLQRTAGC